MMKNGMPFTFNALPRVPSASCHWLPCTPSSAIFFFHASDFWSIEMERKVIHEEWRAKRNAQSRMTERLLPQLFPGGNRYADRLPIGLMEVVDNFPYETLRRYYKKWYRPDLQGIIVVGDIDADHLENVIRTMWSDIPRKENASLSA